MTQKITAFTHCNTPVSIDQPRPERLVSSHSPRRETWNHYTSNGVSTGLWRCEPGAWRIAFAAGTDEFFHVIAGRLRITDAQGCAREFTAGEAGVIPAGFTGLFEVLETVSKHYVFVEREKILPLTCANPDMP